MNKIQIYTTVIVAIQLILTAGICGGRVANDDPKGFGAAILSSVIWGIMMLPIFGRIFGWW